MDADAADYIERIEDDLQMLVAGAIKQAVNRFVVGCKTDYRPVSSEKNWDAIAAGCCALMAGWPSYLCCFHQLTGPSTSTNNGFASDDYGVDIGLKGNGYDKWIVTGLTIADMVNNDASQSYYTTEPEGTVGSEYFGGISAGTPNRFCIRSNGPTSKSLEIGSGNTRTVPATVAGFSCASKWGESDGLCRYGNLSYPIASGGTLGGTGQLRVFRRQTGGLGSGMCSARIAWYHFGLAVDPIALERRVKQYMREISGTIGSGFPLSRLVN